MNKRAGFSLMEMMIVLLIVAIVAAASAPMINKKMLSEASNKSPWVWTDGSSIAFNLKNAKVSAVIGGISAPSSKPRLFVNSKEEPQITLGFDKYTTPYNMNIMVGNDHSIAITNGSLLTDLSGKSVTMGYEAKGSPNSVTIGYNVKTNTANSVSIGCEITEAQAESIAIGHNSGNLGAYAVAVGSGAKAKDNATALGYNAKTNDITSIAIGNKATTDGAYSIAIGGNSATGATVGAHAKGANDIAIGNGANTGTGGSSIAIGDKASASGAYSIAIGPGQYSDTGATASSNQDIAIGSNAKASGSNTGSALALGASAQATSYNTIALGGTASAGQAIAAGHFSKASNSCAVAIGYGSDATGENSTSLGSYTTASHKHSIAIGTNGKLSTAKTQTTADYQIVLGSKDHTVYIPGNLIVGKEVVLGCNDGVVYIEDDDDGEAPRKVLGNGALGFYRGDAWTKPSWLSDRRLKNVGKAFVGGLEEIKKLEVFNYTFKKDPAKTPRVGVMAQDLQKIFPDAVMKGEDGFLRIRMEDIFYALVNAVKELAAKFDLVDKRIAELEKQNQELKKQNEELQKTLKSIEKRLSKLEK